MRIPEKFKERMRTYPGVDTEKLFAALESDDAVKSFRVNNIKLVIEAMEYNLLEGVCRGSR